VPDNLADDLAKVHLDHGMAETSVVLEAPFDVLFLLGGRFSVELVLFLPLGHALTGLSVEALAVERGLDNEHQFLVDHCEQAIDLARAPLDTVNDSIWELVFTEDSRGLDVPHYHVVVFIARCQIPATVAH
jgi:hypothetical protein